MQIEGRNPVYEALKAGSNINKLFLQKDIKKDEKITEIIKEAQRHNVHIAQVKKFLLDKESQTGVHQGVIAFGEDKVAPLFPTLIQDNHSFIVYIREALYEHNIGAIIRTAECAGATAVILPPKVELTPQIRRASMGATEHIPIMSYSLFQAIKEAKDAGLQIVGIERSENSTNLYNTKLKKPLLLIIGGEDRSLSPQILEKCDATVEIPMKGHVNSLNMSVAAAIVIYEVVRQEL
jgi:23S rRNA (guanosine2251-2'-O)-methyltransferase